MNKLYSDDWMTIIQADENHLRLVVRGEEDDYQASMLYNKRELSKIATVFLKFIGHHLTYSSAASLPERVSLSPPKSAKPLQNPAKPLQNPAKPLQNPAKPLQNPAKPLQNPADELIRNLTEVMKMIKQAQRG
ncbi:MAG: hypothetical protein E6K85_00945 [Thaumarchaeota archaeon]|nr:MAG: hypothetical protein E6K85_00945 [Nitrososphaerota archaeon]